MPYGYTLSGLARHALTFPWRSAQRQAARWRRGQFYVPPPPAWWPAWLGEWPGIRSPHDGQSVVIFESGRRYEFVPAAWGRYRGHVYRGTLHPDEADVACRLDRLGLPTDGAPILAIISGFEGGYDSLQTFDRGKMSWGFIQFAATGGLLSLLRHIKAAWPAVFDECFSRAGIDVTAEGMSVIVSGRTITGWRVPNRLHDEPSLWMAFVRASFREEVKDAQVAAAWTRYYAHPLSLPVRLGGRDVPLGELFADDRFARAFFVDRAVNHGVGHVRRLLWRSVDRARARSVHDAGAILARARAFEVEDERRIRTLEEKLTGAPV